MVPLIGHINRMCRIILQRCIQDATPPVHYGYSRPGSLSHIIRSPSQSLVADILAVRDGVNPSSAHSEPLYLVVGMWLS